MRKDPSYGDVVLEVYSHLSAALDRALDCGLEKDKIFLDLLIPFGPFIKVKTIKRIIFTYKDIELKPIISLVSLSENLKDKDKMVILNIVKHISEENMEAIFKYNSQKINEEIFDKLFQNKTFIKKQNYLNFLITTNTKSEKKNIQFIKYQITLIENISRLIEILKKQKQKKILVIFIIATLKDCIGLNKDLILKAISLLTGIKLDNIYESNLLIKNNEVDNIILEFIETSDYNIGSVAGIFESNQLSKLTSADIEKPTTDVISECVNYINSFVSDIKIPKYLYIEDVNNSKEKGSNMLDMFEKILILKKNALFKELKTNELLHIAKITNEITIPHDTVIINNNEIENKLYIIISGEVKIVSRDNKTSILKPGENIGELSIIEEEPRHSQVITSKETTLLTINRDDFLLTLKNHPLISINIMKKFTKRLRNSIRGNINDL